MQPVLLFLFLPFLYVHAHRGLHPTGKPPASCIPRDNPVAGPQPLPLNHINDNYCHCLLGEDEPGTAACPHGTFWCRNQFYKPKKLPSSFVDDGNCDCCDGSDEPAGVCPDVCKQLRGKELQVAEERASVITAGVKIRKGYVRYAQKEVEKDRKEIRRLERELRDVERKLKESESKAELLRKKRDYEDSLRAAGNEDKEPETDSEGGYMEVDEPLDRNDYDDEEEEDEKEEGDDYFDDDGEEEEGEGKTGTEENEGGNEDGNEDEQQAIEEENEEGEDMQQDSSRVEESDTSRAEYADSQGEENEVTDTSTTGETDHTIPSEDNAEDTSRSAEVPSSETAFDNSKPDVDTICAELESTGTNIVSRFFSYTRTILRFKLMRFVPTMLRPKRSNGSSSHISKCLSRADSAKWELESRKRDLESSLEKLRKKSEINYGSDGALRQLHGKCHKKKLGQYEFEHCPFDLVRQYEHGSSIAVLGRFSGWEGGKLSYPSGDHCWNGPARSIVVELSCGKTEDIVSVEEPNRCAYAMKFETPAVCEEAAAKAILAEFGGNETEAKEEL